MNALESVGRRFADGWRPATFEERLWVRGGGVTAVGPDRDGVETYDESEPMRADEERALIERAFHKNVAGGLVGLDVEVVIHSPTPEPEDEPPTGAPNR